MKLQELCTTLFVLVTLCLDAQAAPNPNWVTAIAASDPLNWYQLDEVSGSIAFDSGSQQLNGTYGSGNIDAERGVDGLVGRAVRFGDQSTVFLSGAEISGDWSAEFILKRTGSKRSSVLIRGIPFAFPSTALKLEQYPNTGQIGFTQFGQGDATFNPPVYSPLNEWIHLVYVNRVGVGIDLYLDGELAASTPATLILNRDQIGSWSDTIPESPLAIIDEVVIYSRAINGAEVAAHFAVAPEPSTSMLMAILGLSCASVWTRRRSL